MEKEENKKTKNDEIKQEDIKVRFVVKKKNKHLIILGVLFIFLVLACVGAYYYETLTNPTAVYQTIVKESLGDIIKFTSSTVKEDKTNLHLELWGTAYKLENEAVSNLINNVRLNLNLQTDIKEKQAVLKVESTYNNEELLNGNVYLNANSNKMHIYAKDVLDKYIELDIGKYLEKAEFIVGENSNIVLKDYKTALNILEKKVEFLITETMCTKEGSTYLLKTSRLEIAQKIQEILTELKEDEAFLNCFENKETVKEKTEEVLKDIDLENIPTDVYEVRIHTKGLMPALDKIEIVQISEDRTTNIKCYINESSVQVFVSENEKAVINISIDYDVNEYTDFIVNLSFETGETISIHGTADYDEIDKLEKIDETNVKTFEELTVFERMSLLFNIKNPNLYKLLLPLLISDSQ